MQRFERAEDAFLWLYDMLSKDGKSKADTLSLPNVGFYIDRPLDNLVTTEWRSWSKKYADREWAWYMSMDRSVEKLAKYAPIWNTMHNGDYIVNSNYGWQWNRNQQLFKQVVEKLLEKPTSRQACITIFDGKEHAQYDHDTPCTLNICFAIEDGKLNMSVFMRSNDIWFGFCNDQYCFSKLMESIAKVLKLQIGWYYHHAVDMHLYKIHIGKKH